VAECVEGRESITLITTNECRLFCARQSSIASIYVHSPLTSREGERNEEEVFTGECIRLTSFQVFEEDPFLLGRQTDPSSRAIIHTPLAKN